MVNRIKQAAVIGAGTMGSKIAAVIANADVEVLLLDIVPPGANDRDMLAKKAIQELQDKKFLFSDKKSANIQPGNIEDDAEKLELADWIIECVPENERIKHETYHMIAANINDAAVISSNTSTIPLRALKEGLPEDLRARFCITHFFNPPTKMPLLELVADQDNYPEVIEVFRDFADNVLGKNVVIAKDTPGFIANRIGIFWLLCAIEEAKKENLPIEMADAIMNGAFGFPKTGVFGLADLIGLKIIPDIAGSMCEFLGSEDAFCQLSGALELIEGRIKAGSGFYKRDGEKQALDLKSGKYRKAEKPRIVIDNWHKFLLDDNKESRFALNTLIKTLGYAARVTPEIAESILDVDSAMKDGYGWQYGPFEMMDRLGASWLAEKKIQAGGHPPILLKEAEQRGFYPKISEGGREYLDLAGCYRVQEVIDDRWEISLKTYGTSPIVENEHAKLWDIGDGITCLEFTSKMGVIDQQVLDLLVQSIEKTEADFQGMVIGHDGRHFSAGLNLNIIAEAAAKEDWQAIDNIIKQGQDAMMRIKYARVPVIPALCGYVLGGACELVLHCVAAQAHIDTQIGLVEAGIGVIPAWGGTKESLVRALEKGEGDADKVIEAAVESYRRIARIYKSANAEDALESGILSAKSRITRNRQRLLADAKQLCAESIRFYTPRISRILEAPVDAIYQRLKNEADILKEAHDMDENSQMVLERLAEVLSGYAAVSRLEGKGIEQVRAGWEKFAEQDMLDSSRIAFVSLMQEEEAIKKIRKVIG